jgi:hypothetical protein
LTQTDINDLRSDCTLSSVAYAMTIIGVGSVIVGNQTSYTWSGLSPLTLYQWYASSSYLCADVSKYGSVATDNFFLKTVSCNVPPSVNNLLLDSFQNTVCGFTGGARVRFNWTFADVNVGDTQKDYQIQVDNNSDFSSPLINVISYDNNSQMFVNDPPTHPLLAWNTVYYWRVQVWDSAGNPSGWFYPPSSSVGPGVSFTTPAHSFPYPSFTSSPARPTLNTIVSFIDGSYCYSSPGNIEGNCSLASYAWDFTNDGITDSTKKGNTTTTYNTTGIKTVTLKITDSLGFCSISKDINIGAKVPVWQEVSPIIWLRAFFAQINFSLASLF